MNIVAIVAAWVLTVFLSLVFLKAGSFKLTAPIETLAAAGMAWTKQIPSGLVRAIALVEIIGVAGIVLAPIASEFLGFGWAQPWGVAAAAGLTLTMAVAAVMHIVRGEFKHTYKINLMVTIAGLILTVLLALYGSSVFA